MKYLLIITAILFINYGSRTETISDYSRKIPTDIGHDEVIGHWEVDTIHVAYPSLI